MAVLKTVYPSQINIFMECPLGSDSAVDLPPTDHLQEDQRCQEGGRGAPAPEERGDTEHPRGPPCAETLPEIQAAKGDAQPRLDPRRPGEEPAAGGEQERAEWGLHHGHQRGHSVPDHAHPDHPGLHEKQRGCKTQQPRRHGAEAERERGPEVSQGEQPHEDEEREWERVASAEEHHGGPRGEEGGLEQRHEG